MPLSKKQLEDVCLLHNIDYTATCRYLVEDDMEPYVFHCQKLRPKEKAKVDLQIIEDMNAKNNHVRPLGDNCQGYPIFYSIEVGYDK